MGKPGMPSRKTWDEACEEGAAESLSEGTPRSVECRTCYVRKFLRKFELRNLPKEEEPEDVSSKGSYPFRLSSKLFVRELGPSIQAFAVL